MKKTTFLKFILTNALCFLSIVSYAQIIEDGTYVIFSSVNEEVVTADADDIEARMAVPVLTDLNQQWVFTSQGNDIYRIQNVETGSFMGVNDNWCGRFGDVRAGFASTDTNLDFRLIPGDTSGTFLLTIAFTQCNFGSVNDPVRAWDIADGAVGGQIQTFDNDPSNLNQQFQIVAPSTLNLASNQADIATIYYNQNSGLNIRWKENMVNPSLNIYDLQGKLVVNFDLPENTGASDTSINLGFLSRNIYLAQLLADGGNVQTTKIVVE